MEVDAPNGVGNLYQGKRVLITGGGGYFGHKLGNELKRQGAEVILFDVVWPFNVSVYSQMQCVQVCLGVIPPRFTHISVR